MASNEITEKCRGVQKFLTARDIAERYGFTASWVFKKVREGKLCPPIKFGRHSRWPIALVVEAMENGIKSDKSYTNNGRPSKKVLLKRARADARKDIRSQK